MTDQPLRVAFFFGGFPSNSSNWFTEQVTSLIDLGVDVRIFAFERGGSDGLAERIRKYDLVGRTTYLNVPRTRMERWMRAPLLILKFLIKKPSALLKVFKPGKGHGSSFLYLFRAAPLLGVIDRFPLIHCHMGMIANKFAVIRELLELRQPFLTTFYGQDSSKYIKAKGPHCYDYLKEHEETLLVMTEEMKERMIRFGFPADRVRVHYTGIITEDYPYAPRHYIPGEKFKIVFAGRFVEKKGLPDLFRAFAIVSTKHPEAELHVFGDEKGTARDEKIDPTLRELNLGERVILHGMVLPEDMHRVLPDMHLMVQPSKTAVNGDTDDLPVVLLEAQATGLPVVTTRHVGIPDGVEDGKTGFLVPEGDYRAVAEKIIEVIEHPEKLPVMSSRAHEFMKEKFDLIAIDKKLIALYKEILERQG